MKIKTVFKSLTLALLIAGIANLPVHAQQRSKKESKADSVKKERKLKTGRKAVKKVPEQPKELPPVKHH